MKIKNILVAAAIATFTATLASSAFAEGQEVKTEEKKGAAKSYPLGTCIVSGDKLGEMGKPVVFEYKGQEIKLCCKDCRKDFDKDPAKYLKKLVEKKVK